MIEYKYSSCALFVVSIFWQEKNEAMCTRTSQTSIFQSLNSRHVNIVLWISTNHTSLKKTQGWQDAAETIVSNDTQNGTSTSKQENSFLLVMSHHHGGSTCVCWCNNLSFSLHLTRKELVWWHFLLFFLRAKWQTNKVTKALLYHVCTFN